MAEASHPRHAVPDPLATIRTPRFWLTPVLVPLIMFSALAALHTAGILNPTPNLHHFPVAVVNSDAGPTGKQIVDGLTSGLNRDQFDVRVLTPDEAAANWAGHRSTASYGFPKTSPLHSKLSAAEPRRPGR